MRLSELLGCPVETEAGRRLGRLFDVRADLDHTPPRLTGLVVGRVGLLERLGIGAPRSERRTRSDDVVAWTRVVRLESGRVVVRDDRDA